MFEGGILLKSTRCNGRSAAHRPIAGGRDAWVLVARPGADVAGLLGESQDGEGGAGFWTCRAVLDGGVVLLEEMEPEPDRFLSDLIRAEDGKWA